MTLLLRYSVIQKVLKLYCVLGLVTAMCVGALRAQTLQVENVYEIATDVDGDVVKFSIPNGIPSTPVGVQNSVQLMDNGDAITIPFTVPVSSIYSINVRLRTGSSYPGTNYNNAYTFQVDGIPRSAFPDGVAPDQNGNYYMGNLQISNLSLAAGTNHTLRIQVGWSHCYVDSITVVNTAPAPTPVPTPLPASNTTTFNGVLKVNGQLRTDAPSYARVEFFSGGAQKWTAGMHTTDDFIIYKDTAAAPASNLIIPTGNIGIGTYTPGSRLTVANGQIRIDSPEFARTEYYSGGVPLWTTGTFGTGKDYLIARESGAGPDANLIILNGNVGIGTNNPTQRLAVNGTIRAKEVIVETAGWSDYVFEKDYPLMSLQETEIHIRKHGHLPGIPSAGNVSSDGLSLGDFQAKLLAKIEELTLHQIALEKRIHQLEADNAALRQSN